MMLIILYLIPKTDIEHLRRERQLLLNHLSQEHIAYRESD